MKKSMFEWNRKSEELHAIRNDLDEQRLLVMEVWKAVTGGKSKDLSALAPSMAAVVGAPASLMRGVASGLSA